MKRFFHPDIPGQLLRLRVAKSFRSWGEVGPVRSPQSGWEEKEIAQVPTGWLEMMIRDSKDT